MPTTFRAFHCSRRGRLPRRFFPSLDLWVKRDDLACPHYGGNKARKFEWILGELRERGKRGFLTFGTLCSNHATASAIYGKAGGFDVHLALVPTPLTPSEYEELRLQAYLGACQTMLGASVPPPGLTVVPPAGRA